MMMIHFFDAAYCISIIVLYLAICYLLIDIISLPEYSRRTNAGRGSGGTGSPAVVKKFATAAMAKQLPEISCLDHQLAGALTCTVCLEGFRKEGYCKVFPVCEHVFHAQCIDLWLARRPNCPVCRLPLKVLP